MIRVRASSRWCHSKLYLTWKQCFMIVGNFFNDWNNSLSRCLKLKEAASYRKMMPAECSWKFRSVLVFNWNISRGVGDWSASFQIISFSRWESCVVTSKQNATTPWKFPLYLRETLQTDEKGVSGFPPIKTACFNGWQLKKVNTSDSVPATAGERSNGWPQAQEDKWATCALSTLYDSAPNILDKPHQTIKWTLETMKLAFTVSESYLMHHKITNSRQKHKILENGIWKLPIKTTHCFWHSLPWVFLIKANGRA